MSTYSVTYVTVIVVGRWLVLGTVHLKCKLLFLGPWGPLGTVHLKSTYLADEITLS